MRSVMVNLLATTAVVGKNINESRLVFRTERII
jgi:hypothetical protein